MSKRNETIAVLFSTAKLGPGVRTEASRSHFALYSDVLGSDIDLFWVIADSCDVKALTYLLLTVSAPLLERV